MDEPTCQRSAHIMVRHHVTRVICILLKSDHPEDWHRDSIIGSWDEVEELDERYTP